MGRGHFLQGALFISAALSAALHHRGAESNGTGNNLAHTVALSVYTVPLLTLHVCCADTSHSGAGGELLSRGHPPRMHGPTKPATSDARK